MLHAKQRLLVLGFCLAFCSACAAARLPTTPVAPIASVSPSETSTPPEVTATVAPTPLPQATPTAAPTQPPTPVATATPTSLPTATPAQNTWPPIELGPTVIPGSAFGLGRALKEPDTGLVIKPQVHDSQSITATNWLSSAVQSFSSYSFWRFGPELDEINDFVFSEVDPQSKVFHVWEERTNLNRTIEATSVEVCSYCDFRPGEYRSPTCERIAKVASTPSKDGEEICTCRLRFKELTTGRVLELDWWRLYWRPITSLSWNGTDTLQFIIMSEPHYGVTYTINFREHRFVLVGFVSDQYH